MHSKIFIYLFFTDYYIQRTTITSFPVELSSISTPKQKEIPSMHLAVSWQNIHISLNAATM